MAGPEATLSVLLPRLLAPELHDSRKSQSDNPDVFEQVSSDTNRYVAKLGLKPWIKTKVGPGGMVRWGPRCSTPGHPRPQKTNNDSQKSTSEMHNTVSQQNLSFDTNTNTTQ